VSFTPATIADVPAAATTFAAAFARDPLMTLFFHDHPDGNDAARHTFFRLLMLARVSLGMPAFLAREGDRILGGAMGYDTRDLEWPAEVQAEFDALENRSPKLPDRFARYGEISKLGAPPEPNWYLGVIGVAPEKKGTGLGGRLMREYCARSDADAASKGVYLETGNSANVPFYRHHGFEVLHAGRLEEVELTCLFRPRP
jgi:GNAT superfamily N-acetyltransferase